MMACTYAPALDRLPEAHGSVVLLIEPRMRDLGSFSVRRVLPAAAQPMVGPFIFFDHLGPYNLWIGQEVNIRPHPHIGLTAVTYLFEGDLVHRDSLGNVQRIHAGGINVMTAGRGIVHSERTEAWGFPHIRTFHGIQAWLALPEGMEDTLPSFAHYPAAEVPCHERSGVRVRVLIGEIFGVSSPVKTHARATYLDVELQAQTLLTLDVMAKELAVYVVRGRVHCGNFPISQGTMALLDDSAGLSTLRASEPSRVIVIGGDPVGERHIWWNFVSSSALRIDQAKKDWKNDCFLAMPTDCEFIPLPAPRP